MGCIFSARSDINDTHPNVFVVFNIDDDHNKVSQGNLQVTDSDVILHQRGKDKVRWPLKSLRRYGAEGDIFSFESGRKCSTGPGIYAFRCQRAERLLALLQDKVRSSAFSSTNPQQRFTQSDTDALPDPGPRQTPDETLFPVVPVQAASAANPAGDSMPNYANVSRAGGAITLEASDGYLVPNTPVAMNFSNGLCSDREYQNVVTNGVPNLPPKRSPSATANLKDDNVFFRDDFMESVRDEEEDAINYISVDFEQTGPPTPGLNGSSVAANGVSGSGSESPPALTGNYSTIDIDRTQALCNTAKMHTHRGSNGASDSPVGLRKTRHNCSLSELTTAGLAGPTGPRTKRNSVID